MISHYQETSSKIIFAIPDEMITSGDVIWSPSRSFNLGDYQQTREAYIPAGVYEYTHETVGGRLHEDYYSLAEERSLINTALNVIGNAQSPDVIRGAKRILLTFDEMFSSFRQSGFDLGYLPQLHASIVEDKSVLIEWIFRDFRVGFSVESNEDESGWYLVTNRKLGEIHAAGRISDIKIDRLLLWLLNFAISYSQP